jgi:type IV pilus biogenesis protein CpaD/CtpE
MRGRSGIIALTLSALVVGGCATRSDVMRGNKIDPYQNTDRPLIPYKNANRPIMALDFGADESRRCAVEAFCARACG